MTHAPPDRDSLAHWLHLASAPGLTAHAREALLRAFDSPGALLHADPAALAAVAGPAAARAVHAFRPSAYAASADAVQAWLAIPGHALLTRHDAAYPPRFAVLHDPPPLLYVSGDVARLAQRAIAIVGSRQATPQGRADAGHFAQALADAGFVVVSGLARGIDAAAHRGALVGAADTVAIVGTGADLIYPAAHRTLAADIARHGAVLSEWPLGTPARAAHFPQRNRLIAALCDAVLVIEAAPRSGSLITARLANELGREVCAIPGSIHAPLSRGCHALIRDGAALVEAPEDVLEALGIAPDTSSTSHTSRGAHRSRHAPPAPIVASTGTPHPATASATAECPPLPPDAQALLDALGHGPVAIELLAGRSGLAPDRLPSMLLRLELAGHIALLPGDRCQRLAAPAPRAKTGPAMLHSGEAAQPAPRSNRKEPQCPR
ncbi:MAG: DNA processing protein DprA [Burkholderia plantarii]|nr:MAG: DNA processing protein DprA [Burkholderia plantarii]